MVSPLAADGCVIDMDIQDATASTVDTVDADPTVFAFNDTTDILTTFTSDTSKAGNYTLFY
jgi:hypothetical protein